MSACADREGLLHGLLDGELDAVNTLACESHLRACPECAAEFERLQALRKSLRAPGVRFEAPIRLRGRIAAALEPLGAGNTREKLSTRRPAAVGRWWAPWPVAAGAVAALAAASLAWLVLAGWPGLRSTRIADELVSSHVRSLLAAHLTDVETSDRHLVKPWFNGRIDFAPPVIELSDRGFPLAGGRLDYIEGRVVAALVYRRRQHVINLFVWPLRGSERSDTSSVARDGYSLTAWTGGGLQFWAVSDLGPADLQEFRQAFAQRAQP